MIFQVINALPPHDRDCSLLLQVVKEKISNALKDMPSTPDMKKLLEGSCFHYFKCLKIVDVLKDTEKDSKNIFGMYSSRRIKVCIVSYACWSGNI